MGGRNEDYYRHHRSQQYRSSSSSSSSHQRNSSSRRHHHHGNQDHRQQSDRRPSSGNQHQQNYKPNENNDTNRSNFQHVQPPVPAPKPQSQPMMPPHVQHMLDPRIMAQPPVMFLPHLAMHHHEPMPPSHPMPPPMAGVPFAGEQFAALPSVPIMPQPPQPLLMPMAINPHAHIEQAVSANALERLQLPADQITETGIIPTTPYYDLPAGLMVSLVPAHQVSYVPINPADLRLPLPKFPDETFMRSIDEYYKPVDKLRDNDGWHREFIDAFIAQKRALAEQQ